MPSSLTQHPEAGRETSPGAARWTRLARMVRAFEPSIVVLIARKAPRIAQALELDFGRSAMVVSDLALPFIGPELDGSRVAIVDDIVNVGSTLLRAKQTVSAAGAAEVEMFVIADSASEARVEELGELHTVEPAPLDRRAREALSAEIPGRLQSLGRPYDLDFPLLVSHLHGGRTEFSRLVAQMSDRYGPESVYDLSTPIGAEAGIRRLTVDFSEVDRRSAPTKVRAYLNEERGECVLAPIRLETPLPCEAPVGGWPEEIWNAMEPPDGDAEARARARVYLDSLDLGLRFAAENADVFHCDIEHPLLAGEAGLVFGPKAEAAVANLSGWPFIIDRGQGEAPEPERGESQFLAGARSSGLITQIAERVCGRPDELSVFIELFNSLAEWVGADDPESYRLDPVVPRAEITDQPYLRLRIGPTFGDVVAIVEDLSPDLAAAEVRPIVSRLLDRFIDDGGVVPTTAEYGGALYRIYRKGEKDPRDRAALRARRAWHESGKALSLTRASKLSAILAFSEEEGASDTTVATLTRGNVFCHASSVLHDRAEVAHRLLRTNQLERVRDEDDDR